MQYPRDNECLFCKIIEGNIPCSKVYEDELIFAFLDIAPVAKGHTLVIPKGHYPTLLDVPGLYATPLLTTLQAIGTAMMETLDITGFNCFQNNFSSAGQVVFHAHWHLIPRIEHDNLPAWTGGTYPSQAAMQELAAAISQRIPQSK